MASYIAKQSVGQFKTGEEVTDLTDEQYKALLSEGVIDEVKAKSEPKTDKPNSKK